MVFAVSPKGRGDAGKRKLISFYKTDDEVFSVIFSMMKVRVHSSLKNTQVVRSSGTGVLVYPSLRRGPRPVEPYVCKPYSMDDMMFSAL